MATAYALHPAVGTFDLTAFDEIYHQYHNAVYSNIYKLVRQEAVAEDILQEVFIALWENRRRLEPAKVAGWLFVTSYNKSVKYLKKSRARTPCHFQKTARSTTRSSPKNRSANCGTN
ncbi:RNA polymerase sigma factor [Puia sp. P3]|uniref:RNA polymerase sigma factor n=1 Tax=Puia sp. P3 TaxID=3423952 RepID=UPI003D6730C4